jgi:hypothetical protein
MRHLTLFLLVLVVLPKCRADDLGGVAGVTPAKGWVQVPARGPGDPPVEFPTLRYVPKDGRNAAVLLTLMPANLTKATDLASLKAFLLRASEPMLPSPDFVPEVHELALAGGIGVYASFVDPSLVGKPPEAGNYKVATPVEVLLRNGATIHSTVFTDDAPGTDMSEALSIIQSAAPAKAEAAAAADGFSVAGLGAGLQLPAGRFRTMPNGLNSNPAYFSFEDGQGVVLSGWLDQASHFEGMGPFWAKEKASMAGKGGLTLEGESAKRIGDWDAVLYTVPLGDGVSQKNIRACRVVGDTWADIHVSITAAGSTWDILENTVRSVALAPAQPGRQGP